MEALAGGGVRDNVAYELWGDAGGVGVLKGSGEAVGADKSRGQLTISIAGNVSKFVLVTIEEVSEAASTVRSTSSSVCGGHCPASAAVAGAKTGSHDRRRGGTPAADAGDTASGSG